MYSHKPWSKVYHFWKELSREFEISLLKKKQFAPSRGTREPLVLFIADFGLQLLGFRFLEDLC